MTLEQVQELHRNGFLIGSHSFDHPEFRKISEEERKSQLRKSFDYLDEKINPKVRTFAFPFFDIEKNRYSPL